MRKDRAVYKVIQMFLESSDRTYAGKERKHAVSLHGDKIMVRPYSNPWLGDPGESFLDDTFTAVNLYLESRAVPVVSSGIIYRSRAFPEGYILYQGTQVPFLSPTYCGINFGKDNVELAQLLDQAGFLFKVEHTNQLTIWDQHDRTSHERITPRFDKEEVERLKEVLEAGNMPNPIIEDTDRLLVDIDPGYQNLYSKLRRGYKI